MLGKLLNAAGYKLISWGVSLPRRLATFDQEARLIELLRKHRINCVLDVGAHHGWFAYRLRRAGYDGRIISFEPEPHNADKIEAKSKGDSLWSVERCALGETVEVRPFNVLLTTGGGSTMSSFLEPAIGFANREAINVVVERLDNVLGRLFEDPEKLRLFIKIDTQGFDIPVLRGSGKWLANIVAMQSEVSVIPIYENMTPYLKALSIYEEMGFELVDLIVVNRTEDGRVIEFDCRMVRKSQA